MSTKSRFNRQSGEDEEDGANWQDSYSDLMTDLLAIFVVLFSFAMMQQAIENSMLITQEKSGAIVELPVKGQPDNKMLKGQDSVLLSKNNSEAIVKSINEYIEEADLSKELTINELGENEVILRMASSLLFESGKADISPQAKDMLKQLNEILEDYDEVIEMIRVEGHTDNIPINTPQFDSNWELSTTRAVNVLRWLLDISTIESKKLSAVGFGEFHPICENDTEINRNKNRRVDIIIETVKE